MEKNNAVFMIAVCALAMSIVVGCAENNAPTSYTTTPTPKPAPDTVIPPPPPSFYHGDSLSATINGKAWSATSFQLSTTGWSNDYDIPYYLLTGKGQGDTLSLSIPYYLSAQLVDLFFYDYTNLTTGNYPFGNPEDFFPGNPEYRMDCYLNTPTVTTSTPEMDGWDAGSGTMDITFYNQYYIAGTFSCYMPSGFSSNGSPQYITANGYFAFKVQ